jgi:tetratricopeptide (TPR) repeat protein
MRTRSTTIAALATLIIALPALASMSSPPSTPPPQPQSATPAGDAPAEASQASGRQKAERLYADAYEDVAKAKQELDKGKEKNAQKKFKSALESADQATRLDDKYHEAWNLVGFASRKLGDYDRALKAYDRCLSLKPDYTPAREYLGEAYVELGNMKKAREQMVWLEHLNATDDLKTLKGLIEGYEAAHPDSAAAKPATASGQ